MSTKKHLIWSSDIKVEDWVKDRESIMDNYDYCKNCKDKGNCQYCDVFLEEIEMINQSYLEDELDNLNIPTKNDILVIAVLGLWNGKRNGFKFLKNRNVNAIFSLCEDSSSFYCDGYNLCADCTHHDGTNHYVFRELKDGVDREKIQAFMYRQNYVLTPAQISKYTKSLRPYVKEVCGWEA